MCVSLLFYKHIRAVKGVEGPSHKVGVRVNATSRRITNHHFTLKLVQSEAGRRTRPASPRYREGCGRCKPNRDERISAQLRQRRTGSD